MSHIQENKPMIPEGTLASYVTGFVLSILLTMVAYVLVNLFQGSWSHMTLIVVLLTLAMVQLLVQLIFFLHLLHESKPRWNLIFLISIFGVVFLIMVASIWIMQHLNRNMTPTEMMNYVKSQEGGF